MSKVDIERFVEVECSQLNEHKMGAESFTKSPGLKVQIFLGDLPVQSFYDGRVMEDNCTKIICPNMGGEGKCVYTRGNCLYNNLQADEK